MSIESSRPRKRRAVYACTGNYLVAMLVVGQGQGEGGPIIHELAALRSAGATSPYLLIDGSLVF